MTAYLSAKRKLWRNLITYKRVSHTYTHNTLTAAGCNDKPPLLSTIPTGNSVGSLQGRGTYNNDKVVHIHSYFPCPFSLSPLAVVRRSVFLFFYSLFEQGWRGGSLTPASNIFHLHIYRCEAARAGR